KTGIARRPARSSAGAAFKAGTRGLRIAAAMLPDREKAAREILAFYLEAGVESLIGERPVDRLAGDVAPVEIAAPRAATQPEAADAAAGPWQAPPLENAPAATTPAPASPEIAVMAARDAARRAASLDELRAILDRF